MTKKKLKLPAPRDPDASFCSECPKCKSADTLYVQTLEARVTGMRLYEDGFSFTDAAQIETSDENVYCSHCDETFQLSELTR